MLFGVLAHRPFKNKIVMRQKLKTCLVPSKDGIIFKNTKTGKLSLKHEFASDESYTLVLMSQAGDHIATSSAIDDAYMIPDSVVVKYCQLEMPHVMIEVNESGEPNVRANNTVRVFKLRDTFTREEILKMIEDLTNDIDETTVNDYLDNL